MLHLGITQLYLHYKRTILMGLQIALVMFMGVLFITTYVRQTAQYEPFKDYISDKGFYTTIPIEANFSDTGGIDGYLSDVTEMVDYSTVLYTSLDLQSDVKETNNITSLENDSMHFVVYGYDEMAATYKPQLSSGVWFTEINDSKMLEAVVSPNPYGITTDDIFCINTGGDDVIVHICGILENGASCFNPNYTIINSSLYDFYTTYDYELDDELPYMLFASKESMENFGIGGLHGDRILVRIRNNTSDTTLNGYSALSDGLWGTFNELKTRTDFVVKGKLMMILPIGIGALILVSFGNACIVAVDTKAGLKRYAVLYCCGMKWKTVLGISTVQTVGTGILGFILTVIAGNIVKLIAGKNTFLFEWGLWQLLLCLALVVYMSLISAIIPYFILRKNQPVSVLRSSRL